VANTDFEGGDNDNGYGDYIFLVKHGQPSHIIALVFQGGGDGRGYRNMYKIPQGANLNFVH
jgi:hypothetical protein